MSLRSRLALTLVLTTLLLVPATFWLHTRLQHNARVQGMVEFAWTRMLEGGREQCEADPERFPAPRGKGRRGDRGDRDRRRPPPRRDGPAHVRFWAFRPDFVSDNRRAPPLPERIRDALESGEASANAIITRGETRRLVVGVAMPWDEGPCTYILVEREVEAEAMDRVLLGAFVALCVLLTLAVLAAAGPIVRRIRRLQRHVENPDVRPIPIEGRDEIGGLAQAFNTAFKDIHEREATLRRFVADTTHDVMTPLTVLQGHLAALRKSPDPKKLEGALEEAHYMGALMHNLSAVAKLEGGEDAWERHPVDLNALVERVVARHAPIAQVRGVALDHAVPEEAVTVMGDVTLLEQAVSNLVHNAIRYNRRDGHASVVLSARGESFQLLITDDGPGVTDEQMTHLAERDYRSDEARTRAPSGSGIGLHIAADVAARHEFTLRFAHAEGGGLEATLSGSQLQASSL